MTESGVGQGWQATRDGIPAQGREFCCGNCCFGGFPPASPRLSQSCPAYPILPLPALPSWTSDLHHGLRLSPMPPGPFLLCKHFPQEMNYISNPVLASASWRTQMEAMGKEQSFFSLPPSLTSPPHTQPCLSSQPLLSPPSSS